MPTLYTCKNGTPYYFKNYSIKGNTYSEYLRISGISIYKRDGLLKDSVYSHEQMIFQRQGDLKVVDLEKETEVVTIQLNF